MHRTHRIQFASWLAIALCLLGFQPVQPNAHATPRISEFLADNTSGLKDDDGNASDWIEIFNPSLDPVDLAGWRLTDTASNPSKWRFPKGILLPPGGRIVVFASGKDRSIPSNPLHTNFSLRQDGEFLALYPPTGILPSTVFEPNYPPQQPDRSHGTGFRSHPIPLVSEKSSARLFIPPIGDTDRQWTGSATSEPFDDSRWSETSTRVGFDDLTEADAQSLLGYWDFNDAQQPKRALDASGHNSHGTLIGSAVFGAANSGRSGMSGDRALDFGNGTGTSSVRIDAAASGAFDRIEQLDQVTISLWAFGGPQQPMVNSVFWFDSGSAGDSRNIMVHLPWSDGVIYFDTAGCCGNDTRIARQETNPDLWRGRWNHYVFLKDKGRKEIWQNGVLWHSGDGAAPLQAIKSLWIGSAPNGNAPYPGKLDDFAVWASALSAPDIRSLAAGLSPAAVGSYRPRILTDLSKSMRASSPVARLRIPFVLPAPPLPSSLSMTLRYDDGFIAWINGVEILRRNVPVIRARSKQEGLSPETWDFEIPTDLLHTGTNILAIEGVNDTTNGSDFLLNVDLSAGEFLPGRFFTTPTPGKPNDPGILGLTSAPEFVPGRGFYQAPQVVQLRCPTPGAHLWYTLDGSEPSPSHGTRVTPLSPTNTPEILLTLTNSTAIRVMAMTPEFEPSSVETHTYLFSAQVENQPSRIPGYPATWGVYGAYGPSQGQPVPADYEMDPDVVRTTTAGFSVREAIESLPALCITTSITNLFDAATGIYPNSATQGSQWERPASAELVFPNGDPGFQINAGVRAHGGLSRQHWHARKHSFRLGFSREYGPPRLHYRLFNDSRVTTFNELTLRASSTDGWSVEDAEPWTRPKATYIRDVWMKDTQQSMGWPCGHSRYVHLFLNGVYWGQYNLAERTEAVWLSQNEGGEPEDYDIVKDGGEVDGGDRKIWDAMIAKARAGLVSETAYWALQGRNPSGQRDPALPVYLDVDSLIDYMILHIYAGAIDWPNHNWWSARRRGDSSPGFRFYTWDQEISNISLSITSTYTGEAFESVSGPPDSPAFLYSKLRENASFRRRFAARAIELTSGFGLLTPSQNSARWERRQAEINQSIVAESARWGDSRQSTPLRRSHWLTEMTWMKATYWPNQHAIALERFRRASLYSTSSTPTVTITPAGGLVNSGSRFTLSGTGEIQYTLDGSDPIGPDGKPTAVARRYSTAVPVTAPIEVRARRSLGATWSSMASATFRTPTTVAPATALEVSEIHYHPESNELEEFIELHNRSKIHPLILGGGGLAGGIEFVFPNATLLPPDGRAVVVRDIAAFEAKYGKTRPVAGRFTGVLANEGDWIHLLAASGQVLAQFRYNDAPPWPSLANGAGRSLTLRRSSEPLNPITAQQWRDSTQPHGTPGWDDASVFTAEPESDSDQDGWTALTEYFWGSSDSDPSSTPAMASPIHFTADGRVLLRLQHPLAADQVEASWESSYDLTNWKALDPTGNMAPQVDGSLETLQWLVQEPTREHQFFRLIFRLR